MHSSVHLCLLALAASAPAALASDLHVGPADDLQLALDTAVDGDRILVEPGVYSGTFEVGATAVEIVGLGGPLATVLDGGGAGPVVHFAGGTGAQTVLRGFTIRNGAASFGAGGIQASNASPLIEDCVVRGNSGKFGGGVSGNPILRRCVIRENSASLTHGGGLYGAPELYECVVFANTASSAKGGGLYLTGGTAVIEDSFVVSNRILFGDPARGAGVCVDGNASAVLRRTVIARNTGQGNIFGASGAGLAASSTTLVEACTITGNVLSSGNSIGAGIYGPAQVSNSIVRENFPDEVAGGPVLSWSNVLGGAAGTGNFDADPLWVDRLFAGDLHLLAGSPCIDAGDPTVLDPDGSRSDVGALPYATLYRTSDLVLEDWESPSWTALSTTTGGANEVGLLVDPALAGGLHVLLGSLSGTSPATPFGGLELPLVADAYTDVLLAAPSAAGWSGSVGAVDATGAARMTFTLPAGVATGLANSTLHVATLVFDPSTLAPAFATEALAIGLEP